MHPPADEEAQHGGEDQDAHQDPIFIRRNVVGINRQQQEGDDLLGDPSDPVNEKVLGDAAKV
jgi:hypothetical protein